MAGAGRPMIGAMMRSLLACLLSLCLAAASLTVAEARGRAAGAQQVVICTGYGVTAVALDAQGRPMGPLHPCPDCLGGLTLLALPQAPALPALSLGRGEALAVLPPIRATAAASPVPCARDPPVSSA
ncbi:hypothetical protein D1122_13900 [Cereibacter sphaeroides]|nr:hypothetical protein D1122_13900 [Cereibacter sphaeroides]